VIAGGESWAGVNPVRSFDQAAIDKYVEFDHGVGFIDIDRRKQFPAGLAKSFLRRDEELAVCVAASRDIEQANKNSLRADAHRVIKISRHAVAGEDGCYIGAIDVGENGWGRLDRNRCI
jgi:hypothetical protein